MVDGVCQQLGHNLRSSRQEAELWQNTMSSNVSYWNGGQVVAAEQGQRGIARRVGRPRLARGAPEERILNP